MPIDTALWTFYDPIGNCSAATDGANAVITVPAGTRHDLWTGALEAPRLLQNSANDDFSIETKLAQALTLGYQFAGLIVEQDHNNFIRFDFYSDGSVIRGFAASFVSGVPTTRLQTVIAVTFPLFLRVERVANQWTFFSSSDGITWTQRATFSHTLTVAKAGIHAGNAGSNPAYTAKFDYYFVDTPRGPLLANVAAVEDLTDSMASVAQAKVTAIADILEAESDPDDAQVLASVEVRAQVAAVENLQDTASMVADAIVTGSVNVTDNPDVLSAVMFHFGFGDIIAAVNIVEDIFDSLVAAAQAKVTGLLSMTENISDSVAASALTIATAQLAAVENLIDSAAAAAKVKINLTVSATDNPDVVSIIAAAQWPTRNASVSILETLHDTLAAAAQAKITASLTATDTPDNLDAIGYVEWPARVAAVAVTETLMDTAAATAGVQIRGQVSAQENIHDTAAIAADLIVTGNLSVTEDRMDSLSIIGKAIVTAIAAIQETAVDTLSAAGIVRWPNRNAQVLAVENLHDSAAAAAQVAVSAHIAAIEPADQAAAVAAVAISASINAVENRIDTVSIKMKKNTGWLEFLANLDPALTYQPVINYVP